MMRFSSHMMLIMKSHMSQAMTSKRRPAPSFCASVDILFEDNHVIVVNKHVGMPIQSDKTKSISLLDEVKDYLAKRHSKPGAAFVGLVHRLDRPCSGVVVFAKTSKAASRLSNQFRDRRVEKQYVCVVNGRLEGSEVLTNIHETAKDGNKVHVQEHRTDLHSDVSSVHSKIAELTYSSVLILKCKAKTDSLGTIQSTEHSSGSIGSGAVQSLVFVQLHTGRKHQIRAQLAHIGHPIVGDVKYGAPQSFRAQRDIALHACSLSFLHPISGARLRFAALPSNVNDWSNRFGAETIDAIHQRISDGQS